eukprot:CAMPEP_0203805546 /NCGR_PEP_ID=MMETSP0100_2-20121128/14303_1 /ASSEMBLY_ACC=CAM_ASM_000210 /TAXON_ID=96639 /ORGANISM=" , Strain NY0313808BC1" /LENGTH=66 /DNA_ID=CAMNT_0050714093 /DNA_START=394 /DNA_END=591 /DNA_ORIENTATION=-
MIPIAHRLWGNVQACDGLALARENGVTTKYYLATNMPAMQAHPAIPPKIDPESCIVKSAQSLLLSP